MPFRSLVRTAIKAGAQIPEQLTALGLSCSAACAALTTGPQLLYTAIGGGNLRPYVQSQDDAGHASPGN